MDKTLMLQNSRMVNNLLNENMRLEVAQREININTY